jgi:cell fate regulator YaaT (PSP1 superfamily)
MTEQSALEVLLVVFRAGRKGFFRNNGPLPVDNGTLVILDVDRGVDMGRVLAKLPPDEELLQQCAGEFLREASPEDREQAADNAEFQQEVLDYCRERIESRKLDMKLTGCETQLDRNRIRIFFTADQRTDFRGLVRDLAANYRARIEMRQIGIRDDARHKGGLGICGRELCCSSFLDDFQSVTLKMVRTQNLSLNPSKVSGTCGRLMCCLAYEAELYQQAQRNYPQPGQTVNLMGSPWEVAAADIFHETVTVRKEGAAETEILALEEFNRRKGMERPSPPPKPDIRPDEPARSTEAPEGSRRRRRRRRRPAGAEKERTR